MVGGIVVVATVVVDGIVVVVATVVVGGTVAVVAYVDVVVLYIEVEDSVAAVG